jgi:hypothetical protein
MRKLFSKTKNRHLGHHPLKIKQIATPTLYMMTITTKALLLPVLLVTTVLANPGSLTEIDEEPFLPPVLDVDAPPMPDPEIIGGVKAGKFDYPYFGKQILFGSGQCATLLPHVELTFLPF